MTNLSLLRRDLSWLRDPNTFHRRLRLMVTNHFTTPFQDHGLVSKSPEEDSRDQIQVLMTRLSLPRKDLSSLRDLNTFHKRLRSTVTNRFTTPFQDHGLVSKSPEEDSRDQTQVLMTRLSLLRKDLLSLRDLNMSHRKLRSMVTSHFTTQFQDHGLVSKSLEEDSRDQTQV